MVRELGELGIKVEAQIVGDDYKVKTTSPNDYRKVIDNVSKKKVPFHRYLLPEEKPLKIVIRGMHIDTPLNEIKEELLESGFPVLSVHRITVRREKRPTPLVMVKLTKNAKSKEIFNLRYISFLRVSVEPARRPEGASQCHKCQRFHHTQSMCTRDAKCVKCAGDHTSSDCKMDKKEKPKCVNCGGDHTANYRGCKAFPKTRSNRTPRPAPAAPSRKPAQIPASRTRAGVSYSQALTPARTEQKFRSQVSANKPALTKPAASKAAPTPSAGTQNDRVTMFTTLLDKLQTIPIERLQALTSLF